jgi:hypothetical protein
MYGKTFKKYLPKIISKMRKRPNIYILSCLLLSTYVTDKWRNIIFKIIKDKKLILPFLTPSPILAYISPFMWNICNDEYKQWICQDQKILSFGTIMRSIRVIAITEILKLNILNDDIVIYIIEEYIGNILPNTKTIRIIDEMNNRFNNSMKPNQEICMLAMCKLHDILGKSINFIG